MTTESPSELRPKFNAVNRGVYISDNLPFLRSLNDACIDLVCIDPPFDKNETFVGNSRRRRLTQSDLDNESRLLQHWGINNESDANKAGIVLPTSGYTDIWSWEKDVHEEWVDELETHYTGVSRAIDAARFVHGEGIAAYLCYMAIRLIEIHRVLKPTGSLWLHCDRTANSYIRQLLDGIFGKENLRNEIVWCYPPGGRGPKFGYHQKHDTIYYYGKTQLGKFHRPYRELTARQKSKFTEVDEEGRHFKRYPGGRSYLDESRGSPVPDWWTDIHSLGQTQSKEATGYPTQKPWKLAERIIESVTDPGDVVLDCFAGCAYSAVAAEKTGRRWVACDINPRAWTVFKRQFSKPELIVLRCNDDTTGQQVIGSEPVVTIHGPDELPVRDDDAGDELAPPPLQLPERKFRVPASVIPEREMLRELLELSGYTAWCCGFANRMPSGRVIRTTDNFQLDHIDPKSKQGSNDILNRAPMCQSHNNRKGTRRIHLDDYRKEIAEAGELKVETMGDLVQLPEIRREVELIHTRALNAKYPLLTT